MGCRYLGAAADRPPRAPPSKHLGAAKRSRSFIAATRKLSPIYATETMERVGGKIRKAANGKKVVAKPNLNMMRKKKRKEEVRMGLTLRNSQYQSPIAGSSAATKLSHTPTFAAAEPLKRAEAGTH